MAIFQRQDGFSHVHASNVFADGTHDPQQGVAVPAIQILHHNVQVVLAGETVVEADLQCSAFLTKRKHIQNGDGQPSEAWKLQKTCSRTTFAERKMTC